MSEPNSRAALIARRGELMAELFLQDLNPEFVAQQTGDFGYDFLVGFKNPRGGINTLGVMVKATERPVPSRFSLHRCSYDHLMNSNIPGVLLVVDVKQNRLFHWWGRPIDSTERRGNVLVTVPVTEIDDKAKDELRKRLTS